MNLSKELIYETSLQKQEDLIANFTSRIDTLNTDAIKNNQSASQSEDRTAGKLEMVSALQNELVFAQNELVFLNTINPTKKNDIVEIGAVVITNKLKFFISVSSEKMTIENEEVYGISVKAPIYAAMQGLKKGDSFSFNDAEYNIVDVY